jgi:glutamate synthase domain-containing protein 2
MQDSPLRYLTFIIVVFIFILSTALAILLHGSDWWLALISGALVIVGISDLMQTKRSILRNYPLLGHFRFFFELIRPEIRQYFLEDDKEANPFSRNQRSIVYQRAKQALDKRPFGTQLDVYEAGYEWVNHSIQPAKVQPHDFRILIGANRAQPYSASVFNISAMSFGALSANAIRALNQGAKKGHFMHDTGEGSISRYHRPENPEDTGGDLVWEIGSGYFGCRNPDGSFSEEKFVENACTPQVKMIEIKLSQGAKPGHGGVLPGAKVSLEIAEARGVPAGIDCISPASHSAFDSPVACARYLAANRPASSSPSAIPGNSSASSRRCKRLASCRTSSSSMAQKAARALHQSNLSTTSASLYRKPY